MEQENLNIFYRPNIVPEKSYESISVFSGETYEEPEAVEQTVADRFVKITQDFIGLFSSFKGLPEELGFMLSEINYPILEYLISYVAERIAEEEESSSESASSSSSSSESEYEVVVSESSDEDESEDDEEEDETLIITIAQDNYKNAATQAKEAYANDLALLKEEYISKMNQAISSYFIGMAQCTNAIGTLNDSYLLQDIDPSTVTLKSDKQQYIKDAISKSQIEKENKTLLFSKTHTQENTLVYLRGLIAADALRQRYCKSEVYEVDSSSGYTETDALISERNKQDHKYNQALKEYYKYLNSMSTLTGDILNTTTKEAKLKTSLIQSGVNIYKKADNQATDSSGNTSSALSTTTTSSVSSSTASTSGTTGTTTASVVLSISGITESKDLNTTISNAISKLTTSSSKVTGTTSNKESTNTATNTSNDSSTNKTETAGTTT